MSAVFFFCVCAFFSGVSLFFDYQIAYSKVGLFFTINPMKILLSGGGYRCASLL